MKQANNAYHLLVPLFSSCMGCMHGLPYAAIAWQVTTQHHLLWLSLWFLHSCSASAFFSGFVCFYADPLHNQPSLLATIHGCGTNFIAFLYKAWRKCAHIYIQTLAQNWTAIIKISCLATLGSTILSVMWGRCRVWLQFKKY